MSPVQLMLNQYRVGMKYSLQGKNMKSFSKSCTFLAITLLLSGNAQATIISTFSEDFEGGLGKWVGISGGPIVQAGVVIDPLDAGNKVLGFITQGSGGSIYTSDLITTSGQFTVSFDYLGLPEQGGVPGDLGGFFGISQGFPESHQWIAGTIDNYTTPFISLIDNGVWTTYSLTFTSTIGQSVHLMYEDFSGSGGVAGDVFFDNIRFGSVVPEPSLLALFGVGCVATFAATRRRSRLNRG